MEKFDNAFYAYLGLDYYDDCGELLENLQSGAAGVTKTKFMGCALPKSDFTSAIGATGVTKIFVGIGGEEDGQKTEYTFLMAGLKNDLTVVDGQRYNYGNQYPPEKLKGWDICADSLDAAMHEQFKKKLEEKRDNPIMISMVTGPVQPLVFKNKIAYYHSNPANRLYHTLAAGNTKFYGVIMNATDANLTQLTTSANVSDIVILVGRTTDTAAGTYYVAFIGIDSNKFIICNRLYYSTEYASKANVETITGLSLP